MHALLPGHTRKGGAGMRAIGMIPGPLLMLLHVHPWLRLLHALPLHHIHGAVVGLHTAHAAGACVEFLPKFSPAAVWQSLMVRTSSRPLLGTVNDVLL